MTVLVTKAALYKLNHYRNCLIAGTVGYISWEIFLRTVDVYHDPFVMFRFSFIIGLAGVLALSYKLSSVAKNLEYLVFFFMIGAIFHGLAAIILNSYAPGYWLISIMVYLNTCLMLMSRRLVVLYAMYVMSLFLWYGSSSEFLYYYIFAVIFSSSVIYYNLPDRIWSLKSLQKQYNKINFLNVQQARIISHISHDLRTPLAPLFTLLPMIKDEIKDESTKEMLEIAIQSTNHINNYVESIAEYHRLNTVHFRVNKEEFNLRELVTNVITSQFTSDYIKAFVDIRIDDELMVYADRILVQSVFKKLISNALNFSNGQPNISITCQRKNDQVKVFVADNGKGIEKSQINKIFNILYRADASRTNRSSSGMSLSICRKILELHEQTIKIEHTKLNQGTIISFTLGLKNNKNHTAVA